MQLSPNFSLKELTRSDIATRQNLDNTPPPAIVEKLRLLCVNVLQPVREHFGKSVSVNSGYRSPAVNKAAGGAASSQHQKGEAGDIEIAGLANYDLACWIRDNLDYDQLILEFAKRGQPEAGWVHVSYVGPGQNRKECLSIFQGEGYQKGIIRP